MDEDQRLTVALVDDAELVWCGLRAMCAGEPQISLVQAASPADLGTPVDLVLYDPFANGQFDSRTVGVLLRDPGIGRVVAFTRHLNPEAATRLRNAGVDAVLSKGLDAHELTSQILDLGTSQPDVEPTNGEPSEAESAVKPRSGQLPRLSAREAEVLSLVASGVTNNEIAAMKYLSLNTVKTYIRSAYRKIGVERRTQAVIWAHENPEVAGPGPWADIGGAA